MKQLFIVAVIAVFIAACGLSQKHVSQSAVKGKQPLSDSLLAMSVRWRLDSLGCLDLRSVSLAKQILNELPDKYKQCDSILILLGPPNTKQQSEDYVILSYYCNTSCIPVENEIPDKQWVSFTFNVRDRRFVFVSQGAH